MVKQNKWIGSGYVSQQPKYFPAKGKKKSSLLITLAVNKGRNHKSASYVPLVMFGALADSGANFIKVGKELGVEGYINAYWDKEKELMRCSIVVQECRYGNDSKKSHGEPTNEAPPTDFSEDDIPF